MQTQSLDQLYGGDVFDSAGNKIGNVDGVWVDDATGELEFVAVKTGWLMGKTHIIPAAQAEISGNRITVPYPESQIKDAPSFASDAEISPDEENQIYDYYGLDRSTAPSPTGLPSGERTDSYTTDTGTRGYDTTTTRDIDTGTAAYDTAGTDERTMQLAEEQLQVGKRQVEAGRVRLRKVVRTERQEVPVELRREEVEIEQVDTTGQQVPDSAFQEQEIEVPVMREEPVVAKEATVTGGVRLSKDVETETRTVGDEVRKEDVEVERDTDTDTGRADRTW